MGLTAFVIECLIKLNDSGFKKSLSDAENNAKSWGEKLSGVGEKVGHGLAVAGKAAGAASVAIGKLALDATKAYSEYEQLVGGVETLFGTSAKNLKEYFNQVGIDGSSSAKEVSAAMDKYNSLVQAEQTVMDNAHKAFVTAGMDANTYMQTVTSFSASLLQGLGGDTLKAAQVSDMAIQDMSDNANKMGTDMQSIQNAYQGFAKQNYTMLDNLKLGYGGTKQEMQRLLKDAQKLTGVKYDINNLADVYAAIHAIQEEMGITGTTAEEASTTIQGSTKMMQAAWMNLKIAMVDPKGNIGQAIADMTESIKVAARNWIPAIKQALIGIGEVIKELAPVLAEELPGLISELLPGIAEGAVTLITALANALIQNMGVIVNALGQILDGISNSLKNSDSPLLQALGTMLDGIKAALQWLWDNKETVVSVIAAIGAAWAAWQLGSIVANLNPIVLLLTAISGLAALIISNWSAIEEFFKNLWQGVSTAVSNAWEIFKQWIGDIIGSISEAWQAVADWFLQNVWNPIAEAFTTLWSSIQQLWTDIEATISAAWQAVADWFLQNVWNPIKEFFDPVWKVISELWGNVSKSIEDAWGKVEGVLKPILEPIKALFEGVKTVAEGIWNAIVGIFGYDGKTANIGINIDKKVVSQETDENGNTTYTFEDGSNATDFTDNNGGYASGRGFAKGEWTVPYDDYPARLHRDEMVLTASQARRYRDGESGEYNLEALTEAVSAGIRAGMANAQVNSYLDGKAVTDEVSRILGANLSARRFA